jgi:serine/threonine protein kinase/Flp pilus assembly protein TadD
LAIICPKCRAENSMDSVYCMRCGTALVITPKEQPGEERTLDYSPDTMVISREALKTGTIFAGRYQIIEKLGEGGMGQVYKALDTEIDTKVALKLIAPEIASNSRTIERFRNELRIARTISHKNVTRMFDLGKESGNYFITMEYVEGQDLGGMMAMTKQLSLGTAIGIAQQVCAGLAEAHRLGVVHRDIKPGNIMIDRDGNVKIMDFGIARSTERKGMTEAGALVGTPGYMSPEQVEGKDVDQRSDIYSLGIVMFEMLTGKLPFTGETPLEAAIKRTWEAPRDPKELNVLIPDNLVQVIMRCLNKDREKRFQQAKDLLSALELIAAGLDSSGAVLRPRRRRLAALAKKTFSKPRSMATLAAALALLAALIFLWTYKERPTSAQRIDMLVVLPFENLGLPEDDYFADGVTEEITNRLSALHGLGLISRTSAVLYKKTDKSIRQIGRELGVDYVLEGTIRWDRGEEGRGRVRISPRLIRVSDDTQIWSKRYDQVIADIFSVQSEIAEDVTRELDIVVLEPEREALRANPTRNVEAYDHYLRGMEIRSRAYLNQDAAEYGQVIAQLEEATRLDPGFYQAYLLLFELHMQIHNVGIDQTPERLEKAKTALDEALALQPDLPEVQAALAYYYSRVLGDDDRALAIYEAVYRARPNFSPIPLAGLQVRQGKWQEAIANYHKAFRLDPRSSQSAHMLGRLYAWVGKYEESKHWFERALAIWPDLYYSKLGLARLPLLAEGDTKESRSLLEKLPQHRLTEYNFFLLNLLDRRYDDAVIRLTATSYDFFAEANFYIPVDLAYASVYHEKKEQELMRTYAERARQALAKALAENPDDARYHACLGLAYAYLGQREEAIREGKTALDLVPVAKDAFEGPRGLMNLALIYTIVGEYENAVSQLEYLMSIPCGNNFSPALLRIDPQWDPLRSNPRFQALLR